MPHKKNPITCERVSGLARLLRGNALAGMENQALWHERDISHSSVERVIIPDACIILDYDLHLFEGIIKNMVVYPKRMLENVYMGGGLVFSQRLLLALTAKMPSREEAYKVVQTLAMKARAEDKSFKELVMWSEDIGRFMSPEEIEACFDVKFYLRRVDSIIKRALR